MQSIGHNTVIMSQSKLHIQSKNFFCKICHILYLNNEYVIKRQNYTVIWSQTVISSQSNLHIQSKNLACNSLLCLWKQTWEKSAIVCEPEFRNSNVHMNFDRKICYFKEFYTNIWPQRIYLLPYINKSYCNNLNVVDFIPI